jgi:VWFA-related protein
MKRLVGASLIVAAATVFAQVREMVNVNVVEVPVTVVDSGGNPVRGLTAANFELIDNGTKRAITSFDKIDFASGESMTAISPLNPVARRQFMLLFDLGNSSPNALTRAQEAARQFVTQNVQARDLVSVGTIEAERGFRLLTAFTTDRQLVASAIADPRAFRGNDPLQIANQTVTFTADADLSAKRPPGGAGLAAGEGNAAATEFRREIATLTTKANEPYSRARIERSVDALGQLAKMLRAVPGHKQVIFLSEGFDAKYLQGRDVRSAEEAATENEQILRGQVYNVDSDARYGSTSGMNILEQMAQYFRGSDVVLHAIDIQGVRVQNDVSQGARLNSNAGLFLISRPTGGDVFANANDIKQNFARLLHQQEVVYVLGFQAPTQKPGAFHTLKVRLVNVPSAKISHRAGYYEGGGESAAERRLSNAEIIVNDIPQADVRVNAFAVGFPTKGGNAQVPVILEISGADMLNGVHGNTAGLEVYIYAFDEEGLVRDRLYQKLSFDLKKVGDKLRASGVKYYGTLSLPPGHYAVKSLVRSVETERRGFGRADVVVPKANELAVLPPIPIDEDRKWVPVKGQSHAPSADYPFQLNGQQFMPSAAARKGSGPQKFAVMVYGAKPDEISYETNPISKFLGNAQSLGITTLIFQLDPADAVANSLDVTVHKKGVPAARKSSVAIVQ